MKLKKGDNVKVISGNDKGKQGKIAAVLSKEERIVVEGINIKKKHVRPRQQGKKGELIRIPAPLSASRVLLICSQCGKLTRVGFRTDGPAKKRVCKKCGAET